MNRLCLVLFSMSTLLCGDVDAQDDVDRIWLEPKRATSTESTWYPRAIEKRSGRIVDLDAKQLRLVVAGDEAETILAASRVLWIEPAGISDLQAETLQLYADEKYFESLSRLPNVLKQRPPVWRQQWITMLAANSAWKSRRSKIALELVGQLDRRPLPLMTLGLLPIQWKNGAPRADADTEANKRLSDSSPAVQLVAASWLLSSPTRSQAISTLQSLKAGPRTEIASLAEVLLWRTATPPQVKQLYREWQKKVDALPMALQTGPMRTLVDKLQSAGLDDEAKHLQWSLELTPIQPTVSR